MILLLTGDVDRREREVAEEEAAAGRAGGLEHCLRAVAREWEQTVMTSFRAVGAADNAIIADEEANLVCVSVLQPCRCLSWWISDSSE